MEHDQDSFNLNRRSSSGGLLSPEVELTGSAKAGPGLGGETHETDGFYLLKKDSQRRVTLSKVLSIDEKKICIEWMEKIESDHKVQVVISMVSSSSLLKLLIFYFNVYLFLFSSVPPRDNDQGAS